MHFTFIRDLQTFSLYNYSTSGGTKSQSIIIFNKKSLGS